MQKRKMPRDLNQLAKRIVDMAVGDAPADDAPVKHAASVELGRRGGLIGGPKRAAKLSPERRREIAQKAAAARWEAREGS